MMGGLGIGGAEAAPAPPPPVTGGGFGTPLSYSQGGFWTPDIAGAPESNPFQMMYHPTYAEGIQSAQTAGVIAPNVANAVSGWSNDSSRYFNPPTQPTNPSFNGGGPINPLGVNNNLFFNNSPMQSIGAESTALSSPPIDSFVDRFSQIGAPTEGVTPEVVGERPYSSLSSSDLLFDKDAFKWQDTGAKVEGESSQSLMEGKPLRMLDVRSSAIPQQLSSTPSPTGVSAYAPQGLSAQASPASLLSTQPSPSGTVSNAINNAVANYGQGRITPEMAMRTAHIESSGNPNANPTGTYKGLFQLSDSNFNKLGGGNIFNAQDNANAGVKSLVNTNIQLERALGRLPTPSETYLGHQQGVGGATAHLTNLDKPAWQNMYSTAEGQAKGVGWSKTAIWGNIPDNLKYYFGSVDNVTSRDLFNIYDAKIRGIPLNLRPMSLSEAFGYRR